MWPSNFIVLLMAVGAILIGISFLIPGPVGQLTFGIGLSLAGIAPGVVVVCTYDYKRGKPWMDTTKKN